MRADYSSQLLEKSASVGVTPGTAGFQVPDASESVQPNSSLIRLGLGRICAA